MPTKFKTTFVPQRKISKARWSLFQLIQFVELLTFIYWNKWRRRSRYLLCMSQIAKFMRPIWAHLGPVPMLAPLTLLSGVGALISSIFPVSANSPHGTEFKPSCHSLYTVIAYHRWQWTYHKYITQYLQEIIKVFPQWYAALSSKTKNRVAVCKSVTSLGRRQRYSVELQSIRMR